MPQVSDGTGLAANERQPGKEDNREQCAPYGILTKAIHAMNVAPIA
ncbi:MAG: hypothetical protein J2P48_17860 [Alphaproteobacteria bacterium]|nr:hypothetical protein [Alphaproteobacteria bacterium]